jgi:hypothetical protein
MFKYSDFMVGQTVTLRNGTTKQVTEIWDKKAYFPIRCGDDGWTDQGCWTRKGRSMYSGESYSTQEHDQDIVAIERHDDRGKPADKGWRKLDWSSAIRVLGNFHTPTGARPQVVRGCVIGTPHEFAQSFEYKKPKDQFFCPPPWRRK